MTLHARYTILKKIADGGTAEIFLATQHGAHGFEKPVVLKRIFPAFYADPLFRNMLVNEAHIAMSLNHSNIVQVLDLGEAEGQYVLALELVDGWTLDAVLRRARALRTSVPPALALYMTAEICRALAYAHAKVGSDGKPLGIVHRDISPHNLLLSEQGEVKLTDFGIATARNRRESSVDNMIKGKIAYMSPEQASGAPLDARSDLFSVGTMLYVMICRCYPFDAATDLEVLLLVRQGEYEAPEKALPGLNPEIYRVIKRAMTRSADERYQRAEEMLVDVEQVMRLAFRSVGQTELKRWLQDLSMRDGVPPLTRVPTPPEPASSTQGEGETLELKELDEAAPPASLPPPPPGTRPNRPPSSAGRSRSATLTESGKVRPPPPAAAMAVGRGSGGSGRVVDKKSGAAGPTLGAAETGTGVPIAPQPATPSAATAIPRAIPFATSSASFSAPFESSSAARTGGGGVRAPEHSELTSTPLPAPLASERPFRPLASGGTAIDADAIQQEDGGHAPIKTAADVAPVVGGEGTVDGSTTSTGPGVPVSIDPARKKSGAIEVPSPPRKPSAWVTEAVLASAQRAGTTPAPPVGHAPVFAPPVSTLAWPTAPPPPVAFAPQPEAAPPRSRRGLAVVAALTVTAVVVVGFSIRNCGGAGVTSDRNRTKAAAGEKRGPALGEGASSRVATTTPPPPVPGKAGAGAPSAVEERAVTVDTGGPSPSVATSSPGAASPPPAAPRGASSQTPSASTPPKGADETSTPTLTPTPTPAPAPANIVARTSPTVPPSPETTTPQGGDEAPDGVRKVIVAISSSPLGAEVAGPRRAFGPTPVSIKLRVGRTYALTFTREGYRPVTKHFRVTDDADQQINAVLRRDDGTGPKSERSPGVSDPPPSTPKAKGWFGGMFTR